MSFYIFSEKLQLAWKVPFSYCCFSQIRGESIICSNVTCCSFCFSYNVFCSLPCPAKLMLLHLNEA